MNIQDIPLFSKWPTVLFEEECLFKSEEIELWAARTVRKDWGRNTLNMNDPNTFQAYGYFTLIIYKKDDLGNRIEMDRHRTQKWNRFEFNQTVYSPPVTLDTTVTINPTFIQISSRSIDTFLKKFNSVNRLMAYMMKSYMKTRGGKIPSFRLAIEKYDADLPIMQSALTQIELLKPPRGNNGKVARQGK